MITTDLSACDIIVGVKEVPYHALLDNKIYMFFSHTIKGQLGNMFMLKNILEKGITLLDYELFTKSDPNGSSSPKRSIVFGRFAGIAGTSHVIIPLKEIKFMWLFIL